MLLRCEKRYHKLIKKDSTGLKVWVDAVLKELATNPTMGNKLNSELTDYRAVHSKDETYRIIYKVDEFPEPKVMVIAIGLRGKVYLEATKEVNMLRTENDK